MVKFFRKIRHNLLLKEKFVKYTIGEIKFHSTDNDRKITGILNYFSSKVDYLKDDYTLFNNLVMREITKKLNLTPFKQLNWSNPNEKMKEIINHLHA